MTRRLRFVLGCALGCALAFGAAPSLGAQRNADAAPVIGAAPDDSVRTPLKIRLGRLAIPRRDSSWWVPLSSAILPGTGQAVLGQNRFIAYLAVEAFAVLGYFKLHNEALRGVDQYRAQARDVSRALFPGSRPVGPWSYYESMERSEERRGGKECCG